MILLNAFVLAICLFCAVVCDASALTSNPDQAKISLPNLRYADNADSKGDIERAYIPGLPPIAGVVSKISPSAQKLANKLWLQSKTDPALVFNMLHLGEAAAKLDDNPRFLLWLQYVDMYAKLEFRSFSDRRVFELLQKYHSEEKLVSLFQYLRKIPARKNQAEQMQIYLFEGSASSRALLNEAWLKSSESPAEVFRMLHLDRARLPVDKLDDNSKFLQWFKYCEMYWPTVGRDPTHWRTFKFLEKNYEDSEIKIALLFQALKQRPELEALGDTLQSFLFKTWVDKKFTPRYVKEQLALPWGTAIFELKKDDVFYRALEEYTIYYTAIRGDREVLKTVRDLFANGKPDKALAVATNLARNN